VCAGTHSAPIVKIPPALDGHVNPFIEPGEFYFAGSSDWNPWTPFFSGDRGFIDTQFIEAGASGVQDIVQMFMHCSKKRHEPHYHGKKAAGKYMYLGRYRVLPDDAGVLSITFSYCSLGTASQLTMADHFRRHNIRRSYGYAFIMVETEADNGVVATIEAELGPM
jgi:hypothetical protein